MCPLYEEDGGDSLDQKGWNEGERDNLVYLLYLIVNLSSTIWRICMSVARGRDRK